VSGLTCCCTLSRGDGKETIEGATAKRGQRVVILGGGKGKEVGFWGKLRKVVRLGTTLKAQSSYRKSGETRQKPENNQQDGTKGHETILNPRGDHRPKDPTKKKGRKDRARMKIRERYSKKEKDRRLAGGKTESARREDEKNFLRKTLISGAVPAGRRITTGRGGNQNKRQYGSVTNDGGKYREEEERRGSPEM